MIEWITNEDLGQVTANAAINIQLLAASSSGCSTIHYFLRSGSSLPNGLSLSITGSLTGIVAQAEMTPNVLEQVFEFVLIARCTSSTESRERRFVLRVKFLDYRNIMVRAFLSRPQRKLWNDFVNDTQVFVPDFIQNFENGEYGVNRALDMLVFAGIASEPADKYISAAGLNYKNKRLRLGELAVAQARLPAERSVEYEVVYVRIYDPLEKNNTTLPLKINAASNQQELITADHDNSIFYTRDPAILAKPMPVFARSKPNVQVDTTGYFVSDPAPSVYFPSSVRLWRQRILSWVSDDASGFVPERSYLPLWMRTPQLQDGQLQDLGYVSAVVLCYCIPGTANKIKANIENYMTATGFSFDQFDFTVDRLVVNDYVVFNRNSSNI